ncbi:aldehyde dehydrogenase family protein [Arthrobacter sp. TMS1-12-1]
MRRRKLRHCGLAILKNDQTDIGPLNSAGHLDRVRGHIEVAREDGARLLTGGGRPAGGGGAVQSRILAWAHTIRRRNPRHATIQD